MKRQFATLIAAFMAILAGAETPAVAEGWKPAGTLIADVQTGNAFALSDGRVVSVGMRGNPDAWRATTQIWNPRTKAWKASKVKPALPHLQMGTAVMLDDGRILVTGP